MATDEQHGRRLHPWVAALAVLLVVAGASIVLVALHGQHHAPQPAAASPPASASAQASSEAGAARPVQTTKGPLLGRSQPTYLSVPAIGVSTSLMTLGLNKDNTVQVPPLTKHAPAGWYRNGPTPGQLGPAVILGHIDSARYGPGVFFKLGALHAGNSISVTRADRTVAVFRVTQVASYPKSAFPTALIYGNTDNAALRLITCGGKFDSRTHNYLNNIVVYASLVSSHHA